MLFDRCQFELRGEAVSLLPDMVSKLVRSNRKRWKEGDLRRERKIVEWEMHNQSPG